MFFIIASGLILGSATCSDEFRELIRQNSWNTILKIMEYYTYLYNKIFPRKLKNCCSIDNIHYLVFNKNLDKILFRNQLEGRNINKNKLEKEIDKFVNSSIKETHKIHKIYKNSTYLLFNYRYYRNNNDEIYKFITKINWDVNEEENDLKINFDINKILKFLENNIIEDDLNRTILSCNYNDNDITEILNSYMGPNKDFFSSNMDFRVIVDNNLNLIYNSDDNRINIIYGNLDLTEIELNKIDFNCNNLLQK